MKINIRDFTIKRDALESVALAHCAFISLTNQKIVDNSIPHPRSFLGLKNDWLKRYISTFNLVICESFGFDSVLYNLKFKQIHQYFKSFTTH